MHSHHHLERIFEILWNKLSYRGSFVDIVFRLVLFHQSLIGLKEIAPIVALNKEERIKFCDP
jgi:hypothetical protein